MQEVFIVGCGYVGERVAARERAQGAHVRALARSKPAAQRLRRLGVDAVAGDLDRPESLQALALDDADVYYFAPPPNEGGGDARMDAFCEAIERTDPPRKIVLISTTGVYGDCAGEWIDETSVVKPVAERSRRRLAAEQRLRRLSDERRVPIVVLRVAGIYGPDRLPIERLAAGEPVLREEEAPFSNRVHVDDLAEACCRAMSHGRAGEVYNVTDGAPTTMTDYFCRVADACGLPQPPKIGLIEARTRLSAGMLSYLAESKRIGNRKLREELGVVLRYPNLAAGLSASAAASAGSSARKA